MQDLADVMSAICAIEVPAPIDDANAYGVAYVSYLRARVKCLERVIGWADRVGVPMVDESGTEVGVGSDGEIVGDGCRLTESVISGTKRLYVGAQSVGETSSGVAAPVVNVVDGVKRGKNYWKNKEKKARQKENRRLANLRQEEERRVVENAASGFQKSEFRSVTTVDERKQLARQWYERKKVENDLAIQRAKYNFKRNSFLDRSKISEKKWEHERLTCDEKLAKIVDIRFGSKPGYAETIATVVDDSERPPSLSTGSDSPANLNDSTVSPNSSMSVAEVMRMKRVFEDKLAQLSEDLAKMKLENEVLKASNKFQGGFAQIEGGRVEVYDGTGQWVPPSDAGETNSDAYRDHSLFGAF